MAQRQEQGSFKMRKNFSGEEKAEYFWIDCACINVSINDF
jgi:hypothetical protein